MTPERLLSLLLGIGFLGAPAIALLYGVTPGLVVLAGSLVATLALAWPARESVPPDLRDRLRILMAANSLLLVLTVIALVAVNL